MVRFIFSCMALTALSFVVVPMFLGISKKHAERAQAKQAEQAPYSTLSFQEIYAIIDAGLYVDPAMLNAIEPGAGDETPPLPEKFSTEFSGKEDAALKDIP